MELNLSLPDDEHPTEQRPLSKRQRRQMLMSEQRKLRKLV